MTTTRGHFVWYEHMAPDTKAAAAFYTDVVGWTTQVAADMADYVVWVSAQGPLGGAFPLPAEVAAMGAPPHWMGYVAVDDVDGTTARVAALRGKVLKAPADIPSVGRFAVIADPQGAVLTIFRPATAMPPRDASKPGEVCWNELLTSDASAAFAFYSELFGWEILEEMNMGPMGKYRIFGIGDRRLGGMTTTPKGEGPPPSWLYYVDVADLDGATARATKRGAKVLNGPMEIPGGARIVQLLDPQGAVFALHQQPKPRAK